MLCCIGAGVTGVLIWRVRHDDFTVTGDLTLAGGGAGKEGAECYGTEVYNDIVPGTQIVISSSDGSTVAAGRLDTGVTRGQDCVFPFTVKHVPQTHKFYGVTISQRGTLTYTQKEMKHPLHLYL